MATIRALDSTVFDFAAPLNECEVHATVCDVVNLKANTAYDVYVNGVIQNFVVQPWGKDLGDRLISDAEGSASFIWYSEYDPKLGSFSVTFADSKPAVTATYTHLDLGGYRRGVTQITLVSSNQRAVINKRNNTIVNPYIKRAYDTRTNGGFPPDTED